MVNDQAGFDREVGSAMRIPIVFATDENYIFYTCVAISSLARNAARETTYDISILTGEGFPDKSLLDEVGKKYPNVTIRFIKVAQEAFRNVTINNAHVTKATFYRLLLCDLLDDDRCIYLDSDIVVTEDLQPLYSVELDRYYIAGCRDIWIDMITEENRKERRIRTGIPSMDEYVNGGVLVMNLRKIREDGIDGMLVQHMDKDYLYEDQDIMNVCCYGKILHLPAKWNIFTMFLGKIEEMRAKGIGEDVLEAFERRQGIIHYATPLIRPWEHAFCYANCIWWDVASEWAQEPCYQELYQKVWKHDTELYLDTWLEKCKGYRQIIIFGFTVYGKTVCDWLLDGGFGNRLWFCDNNPKKRCQDYKGIQVLSLDEFPKEDVLFINSSQRRRAEVTGLLRDHGIGENNILCYEQKDRTYYRYLDKCFYLDELKDIFLRERGSGRKGFREDLTIMKMVLAKESAYQSWHGKYFMDEWILKE